MQSFKFICTDELYEQVAETITIETNCIIVTDVLDVFARFLRGCGFSIKNLAEIDLEPKPLEPVFAEKKFHTDHYHLVSPKNPPEWFHPGIVCDIWNNDDKSDVKRRVVIWAENICVNGQYKNVFTVRDGTQYFNAEPISMEKERAMIIEGKDQVITDDEYDYLDDGPDLSEEGDK